MISLAILAIALVALSDLNGGAVAMHAYARKATQATLLLRGKMLDLEDLLHKDGFSDFDDEKHGNFEEDGAPDYRWRAEILKPDVQLDADQLLGLLGVGGNDKKASGSGAPGGSSPNGLSSALGGAGGILGALGGGGAGGLQGALSGAGGGAGGLAAAGPFAGIIQGQAKGFIETLKKSVREVRVTVYWPDGKSEKSISASQQLVILPESVGKAGQTPAAVQAQPGQPTPNTPPLPGQPQARPLGTVNLPSGDGDSQ